MACLFLWISIAPAHGQSHAANEIACGPNAVAVAAGLLDRELTDAELDAAFAGSLEGPHSFIQIENAIRAAGLTVRSVRMDQAVTTVLDQFPMIVMLRERTPTASESASESKERHGHFVVLYGQVAGQIQVLDYPHGPLFIPPETLTKKCDGGALCIGRSWHDFVFTVDGPKWLASAVALGGVFVAVICIYLAKTSESGETLSKQVHGMQGRNE